MKEIYNRAYKMLRACEEYGSYEGIHRYFEDNIPIFGYERTLRAYMSAYESLDNRWSRDEYPLSKWDLKRKFMPENASDSNDDIPF